MKVAHLLAPRCFCDCLWNTHRILHAHWIPLVILGNLSYLIFMSRHCQQPRLLRLLARIWQAGKEQQPIGVVKQLPADKAVKSNLAGLKSDQWDFQGPPIMGSFTHTIPIPLLGVPGITLDQILLISLRMKLIQYGQPWSLQMVQC